MQIMSNGTEPKRCRLLELPPELRLVIYDYVWDEDINCGLNLNTTDEVHVDYCDSPRHMTALLGTCNFIYSEAQPIFYDAIIFHLDLDNYKVAYVTRQIGTTSTCAPL